MRGTLLAPSFLPCQMCPDNFEGPATLLTDLNLGRSRLLHPAAEVQSRWWHHSRGLVRVSAAVRVAVAVLGVLWLHLHWLARAYAHCMLYEKHAETSHVRVSGDCGLRLVEGDRCIAS